MAGRKCEEESGEVDVLEGRKWVEVKEGDGEEDEYRVECDVEGVG